VPFLDYFKLSESPSQIILVDTNGTVIPLTYVSDQGMGWMTSDMLYNYNNVVMGWRPGDRGPWYDQVRNEVDVLLNNVKGIAFADPAEIYSELPNFVTMNDPFRRVGYVFIPWNTPDPRSEIALAIPGAPPPPSPAPPAPPGDENDDFGVPAPAPSGGWFAPIAAGTFGLLAGALSWLAFDYFGEK
jgi:hypothetical protein